MVTCITTFTKACITTFLSAFDVGSDLINSLDFLGYNASTHVRGTLCDTVGASTGTNSSTSSFVGDYCNDLDSSNTNTTIHQMWGYVGIGIIFAPGIIYGIPLVSSALYKNKTETTSNKIFGFFLGIAFFGALYPLILFGIQIFGIFVGFYRCCNPSKNKGYEKVLATVVGFEAFFESFWQMVLQVYTLLYGYNLTPIQFTTIAASLIFLAKTAIEVDVKINDIELNFCETLKHIVKTLPCYAFAITFRVIALSLTIAFLRYWSIIPIALLICELAEVGRSCLERHISDRSEEESKYFLIYLLTLSNIGVMNVGSLMIRTEYTARQQFKQYLKVSSFVTFVHHAIVLSAIMGLAYNDNHYFDHWTWSDYPGKNFILKIDGRYFYGVFGGTIGLGLLSFMMSLYSATTAVEGTKLATGKTTATTAVEETKLATGKTIATTAVEEVGLDSIQEENES